MACEPLIIDAGCRPVHITVNDDHTIIDISHKELPQRPPLILWVFGPIQDQPSGPQTGNSMTTMTATQQVTGTVQPTDKLGNPAPIQPGSSKFTSSDETVLTVEVDPTNELTVTVKGKSAGSAQVRWAADADLGDPDLEISAAADFTITSAQATGASFTFGPPTDQA